MKLRFYSRAQSRDIPAKAWESLAQHSIISNPFYEHWNLTPALENLEKSADIEIVTAWRGKQLVGLFPLCYSKRLPFFTAASVWKHDECYCTSPLVKDKNVWAELLPLLWEERRVHMLINTTQTHQALTPTQTLHLTKLSYYRAALDAKKSYESMTEVWPRKRRKEWRRLLRKSLESDQASYQTAQSQQACAEAFDLYTEIESQGWKGRAGTAIAEDPHKLIYYRALIKKGCEDGRVETQMLMLEGNAIAASIRLICGDIAFEVKTSYSERYRKLAPGVLLEILNMQQLAVSNLHLADSCTQAGNKVMEALWNDKIAVYNTVYFGPNILSKIAWLATKVHKRIKRSKNKRKEKSDRKPEYTKPLQQLRPEELACKA